MPRSASGAGSRWRAGAWVHLPLALLLLCAATLDAETGIVFGMFGVAADGEAVSASVKDRRGNEVKLGEDSGLGIADVSDVYRSRIFGEDALTIGFTEPGADKNSTFTAKFAKRRIAIVFKGHVIAAPVVFAASQGSTVISGPPRDEIDRLVTAMKELIAHP